MTICLAPRGACGGGDFRSRFTCRVFGRASIFASPFLVRRRMTKMAPAGYPALQYLQSGRVRKFEGCDVSELYCRCSPRGSEPHPPLRKVISIGREISDRHPYGAE